MAACLRDAMRFVDVEELSPEKSYAPAERLYPKRVTRLDVRGALNAESIPLC